MERPTAKPRTPAAPATSAPTARRRRNPVDEYLSRIPEPARTTLQKLRKTIQAAAPKAKETISYQLPAFHHLGPLVAFGATAKHCALYVMSGTVLEHCEEDLSAYDTSKGTVRFPAGAPLPAALVKKLVRARVAENEGRATRRARASKARAGRSVTRRRRSEADAE